MLILYSYLLFAYCIAKIMLKSLKYLHCSNIIIKKICSNNISYIHIKIKYTLHTDFYTLFLSASLFYLASEQNYLFGFFMLISLISIHTNKLCKFSTDIHTKTQHTFHINIDTLVLSSSLFRIPLHQNKLSSFHVITLLIYITYSTEISYNLKMSHLLDQPFDNG